MARGAWRRRSLRARVTLVASAALALGLLAGGAGLAVLFAHLRVAQLDAQASAQQRTLVALVASGQLPQPLPLPPGSSALSQVVDPAGTVLTSTAAASRLLPIVPPQRLPALANRSPVTLAEHDTTAGAGPLRVVVTATQSPRRSSRSYVVTALPLRDVLDTLADLRLVLLVVVPLVLAATALAVWLAVGDALAPVARLTRAAAAVRPDERPAVPIPESDDEIALLARTLDAMLGRLHAAADRQRTFLADAAHELRSPIAAITTTLEVALRHPREADWAATARDALAEGERMARLVDDLLLLARADAGPRGTPRAMRPVPLAPVVEAGCSDGAAGARDHVQVQLITSGTGSAGSASEELLVLGEPDALRRVVRNLVENGCRYAASTVTVGVRRDGGSAVVEVSDDGPGIPAEQHERVFERFTRLDLARDRDSGGAGLGLAIARAIAREHGGDVALVDAPHGGVRAVLTLPLADGGAGT